MWNSGAVGLVGPPSAIASSISGNPGPARSGVDVRRALDEPDERPEDRRRPQILVLVEAVGDLAKALGRPAERARRRAEQARPERAPDRQVAGLGHADRGSRARRDDLRLATPVMQEPGVEQPVGERVRMVELGGERDRAVGPLDGLIRVAEQPEEEPRRRQAGHPHVEPETAAGAAGSRRSRTP